MGAAEKSMNQDSRPTSRVRRILVTALVSVVFVLALGYTLTRSAVLKRLVVPRIEKATGLLVDIDQIYVNPFGLIRVDGISALTPDRAPLFTAQAVTVKFSLAKLLSKSYSVASIEIEHPVLTLTREGSGQANWERIQREGKQAQPERRQPTRKTFSGKPLLFEVGSLVITNATLSYEDHSTLAAPVNVVVTNLSLIIKNLTPQKIGEAYWELKCHISRQGIAQYEVAWTCKGNLSIDSDAQLIPPKRLSLTAAFDVPHATGILANLSQLEAELNLLVRSNRIETATLAFKHQTNQLGEIALSGIYAPDGSTARLGYQVKKMSTEGLNFLAAPFGLIFDGTTLEAEGAADIQRRLKNITASLTLAANHLHLQHAKLTIPPTDLQLKTEVQLELDNRRGRVRSFHLVASQNDRPLLKATLERAMNIFWDLKQYQQELAASARGEAVTLDSVLNFELNDLNLDEWTGFFGKKQLSGLVSAKGALTNALLGARISLGGYLRARNLRVPIETVPLKDLDVDSQFVLTLDQLRLLLINFYRLEARHQQTPFLRLEGSGSVDIQTLDSRLEILGEGPIKELVSLVPLQNLKASAGTVKAQGILRYESLQKGGDISLSIDGFTGAFGEISLTNYSLTIELGGEYSAELANLRKFTVRQGSGSVDLSGKFNLKEQKGEFVYNVAGLDVVAAWPQIADRINPYRLERLVLGGNGQFTVGPTRSFSINGSLNASELCLSRIGLTNKPGPTKIGLQLDLSYMADMLKLGTNAIELPPSSRGDNRVLFTGTVDLNPTNQTPSRIKIWANRLDLSQLYDLGRTLSQREASSQPAQRKPGPEHTQLQLPVRYATLEWSVERIFLNDLDIMQCQGTARLESPRLFVDPCQMLINGGRVSLRLTTDLTSPAREMQLDWSIEEVPIDPLMRSFGGGIVQRVGGLLTSHASLRAGNGTNILQGLAGNVDLLLTNLQLRFMPPVLSNIISPIATVLRAAELANSYPQSLLAKANFQPGIAHVEQAVLSSSLFVLETSGQVQLAENLMQTMVKLPLNLSLSTSITERLGLKGLKPAKWPGFTQLPQLAQIRGPINNLTSTLDEKGIAQLMLEQVGRTLPPEIKEATSIISNILGEPRPDSQQGSTNAQSTNAIRVIPRIIRP